jgi:hypothetical protein
MGVFMPTPEQPISDPDELFRLWISGETNNWNNPPIIREALELWLELQGQARPKEEIIYEE